MAHRSASVLLRLLPALLPLLLVACSEPQADQTVVKVNLCGSLGSTPDSLKLTLGAAGREDTQTYPFGRTLPTSLTATLPTSITGTLDLEVKAGDATASGSLELQPGAQNEVDLCFGGCPCQERDAGPDGADGRDAPDGDAPDGPDGDLAPGDADLGDVGDLVDRPDTGGDVDMPVVPVRCDPAVPFALPVPVGTLNTPAHEQTPFLSADGLDLYYASEVSGLGGLDLFVAHRSSAGEPFRAPVALPSVNSDSEDFGPAVTADGRTLYFSSLRSGSRQIYRATRAQAGDPILFPFGTPVLVPELSGAGQAALPWISPDGQRIYYTFYATPSDGRIFTATLGADGQTFGDLAPLAGVNDDSASDSGPTLSADELTLYFLSTRTPGTPYDRVYVATRSTRDADFSSPRLVKELFLVDRGLGYHETSVGLSPDGCTLFLTSVRGYVPRTNDQLYSVRRTTCDQGQPFGDPVTTRVDAINGYFGPGYNVYPAGFSHDGLDLYLNTDVTPVTIYIASRPSLEAPFGNPVEQPTAYPTSGGSLTPDDLTLYYAQDRGTGNHIYRAFRSTPGDSFDLDGGENVAELNITGLQSAPTLAPDGQTLYFGGQVSDSPLTVAVMFSTWDGTTWSSPEVLPNFPPSQSAASLTAISADQLSAFGTTYGAGGYDAVQVSRATVDEDFGAPMTLPFDDNPTYGLELGASLSPDGCSLVFSVARDGSAYHLTEVRRPALP